MFQRILVPLDGSKRAEQALPVAVKIARSSGGSIIVVRVDTPEAFTPPSMDTSMIGPEIFEAERAGITDYLAHVSSLEILKVVKTVTHVAEGLAAPAILAAVDPLEADLIVMCSHGRTGFTRWMLGSVAQKVARHSAVPVLIVREGGNTTNVLSRCSPHPVRVMVALDGSPLAEKAIAPAAQLSVVLSEPSEGALHLVHVVHLPVMYEYGQDDALARAKRQDIQEGQSYLNTIEQSIRAYHLSDDKFQITSSVAVSMNIADMLMQIAEEGDQKGVAGCDVIALVTHGRRGPQRWMIGSVAEHILGATRLPLLIVHTQKSKE